MASSKRPKTLLDILPAEIRYRIYGLALIEDVPINTSDAILAASRHNDSKRRAQQYGKKVPPPPNDAVNSTYPRLQPALLATCRQIRYEAYPMYYAENTFTVEMVDHVKPFLARVAPTVLAIMQPFHVTIAPIKTWPQASCFFERLAECPWERRFCALPVEVVGEGVVYMDKAGLDHFEGHVSYKMTENRYGPPSLDRVYKVQRKA